MGSWCFMYDSVLDYDAINRVATILFTSGVGYVVSQHLIAQGCVVYHLPIIHFPDEGG